MVELAVISSSLVPLVLSLSLEDAMEFIKAHVAGIERDEVEHDPAYKQLVVYAALKHGDKIYGYYRTFHDYREKRLRGMLSIGVGGHVERRDMKGFPLSTLKRELQEEAGIIPGSVRFLGFINDDSNEVGRCHLGLAYVSESPSKILKGDGSISNGKWYTIEELRKKEEEMESWSRRLLSMI